MSHIGHALFCLGVAQLTVLAYAVPSFDIDLDLPPRKRWVNIAKHYKIEMISMHQALHKVLEKDSEMNLESWYQVANFGPDYEAELQGMVDTVNDTNVTLNSLKLFNLLYEMKSPTACAAVLWATSNGTVMHGRNMDYAFHFALPDGSVVNWPNLTFDATFLKAGKPLLKSTQWPGWIGLHTAMRFNGWGFQQNTRSLLNDKNRNLKAFKEGGVPYGLVVRNIMETTPDFKDAVTKLYATKFMAPHYFILSGARPFEGAVLTIDRLGKQSSSTPPLQTFSNLSTGWHLVQTNDDLLQESTDVRRPLANKMLSGATQDIISDQHLLQFMHTSPLIWNETVFSTVMVPATGFYKTVLPDEPPGPVSSELFTNASPLSILSFHRALSPVHHRSSLLSRKRHHVPLASAMQPVGDDVSFMQVFQKLEV